MVAKNPGCVQLFMSSHIGLCKFFKPLVEATDGAQRIYNGTSEEVKQRYPFEVYLAGSILLVDELNCVLAACLIAGKKISQQVFVPAVAALSLKDEVREELQVTDNGIPHAALTEIAWTEEPACFERHLQRRFNNPLFSSARQEITIEELVEARWRDAWESKIFLEDFGAFLKKIIDSADQVSFETAKGLVAEVRGLMLRAAELGSNKATRQELDDVYKTMTGLIINSSGGEAMALEEEQEYQVSKPLLNPFVAQATRKDGPIPGPEFYAAMLCEDLETMHAAFELMAADELQKMTFRDEIRQLIGVAKLDSTTAITYQRKVDALENRLGWPQAINDLLKDAVL